MNIHKGVPAAACAVGLILTGCSSNSKPNASRAAQTSPSPSPPVSALAASDPTRVDISKINAHSTLVPLGLDANGSIAAPPLSDVGQAGWYAGGPTPGEEGPATLVGHVDSAKAGKGVFFDLGKLHPGDTVDIKRRDGRTAIFTVQTVEQAPKNKFPTQRVYANTSYPALRVITCGGKFDRATRNYTDNIIVYARMTSTHA